MLVYENREMGLTAYSLDKERWDDFTSLFGGNGACGGCWCMTSISAENATVVIC
ncbi:hypothetical protein GCM10007968_10140 [Sporolactobacillus putidus]|uniref:Uncharacterized protein n=1 Tax=Sporolactobacillus putidus TaxID=492735 RepID=A0A917VZE5_9BACL|nr:hypothetical protein GCM10007968_10140 [Sporolactobacillus putidus]